MNTDQNQELLLRDALNFYVSISRVYGPEKAIQMFDLLCKDVCPELGQRVFFKMLQGHTSTRVTVTGLNLQHDRVSCVRELRRLTGCGLKEAIGILEQLAQGQSVVLELQRGQAVSSYTADQIGLIIS